MSAKSQDEETILEFVRGERPWNELQAVGIRIKLDGDRCEVENPRQIIAVANAHDLAQGLLKYLSDREKLRTWAFIVQAASVFVDLDVEQHPNGEVLLDALWNAAHGNPVAEESVQAAEQLIDDAPRLCKP